MRKLKGRFEGDNQDVIDKGEVEGEDSDGDEVEDEQNCYFGFT